MTEQITNYAALGYSPRRIAILLQVTLEDRPKFYKRLQTPGDPYHEAYQFGFAAGEYNIDATLQQQAENGHSDSAKIIAERSQKRAFDNLKRKLFGI